MTTTQFTGQPLSVGQWVNLDTMLRIGFAGNPAKIVELKPKSVVVEEAHRKTRSGEVEMGPKKVVRLTNITFVSDTHEEAESMRAASWAFTDAEFQIERELRGQAKKRKEEAVGAALSRKPRVPGPPAQGICEEVPQA